MRTYVCSYVHVCMITYVFVYLRLSFVCARARVCVCM